MIDILTTMAGGACLVLAVIGLLLGSSRFARWLATPHQHLVREDRDDLGADQCPHQFADTHSILNGGERIGIGHHSHSQETF